MKTFENKKTEITKTNESGQTENMSYAELSVIALNNPPQGGWTTTEMRKRLKVSVKLEAENIESVELEDAEYETLNSCVKGVKWNFMHKDIVAFEDYLDGLS